MNTYQLMLITLPDIYLQNARNNNYSYYNNHDYSSLLQYLLKQSSLFTHLLLTSSRTVPDGHWHTTTQICIQCFGWEVHVGGQTFPQVVNTWPSIAHSNTKKHICINNKQSVCTLLVSSVDAHDIVLQVVLFQYEKIYLV